MQTLRLIANPAAGAVTRLLEAMGVVFTKETLTRALEMPDGAKLGGALLIPGDELARGVAAHSATVMRDFLNRHRNVLIYPFGDPNDTIAAIRACLGVDAEARAVSSLQCRYGVAAGNAFTGAFAGLDVEVADTRDDHCLVVRTSPHPVARAIAVADGSVYTWIQRPGSEIFIVSSNAVFDAVAEQRENLAAARCFSALVPLLFFLRHAGISHWSSSAAMANLIIDDLPLRRRYGFVDVARLARQVRDLDSAVSIAFIPWNFDRTSRRAVDLFRSNWPGLSLCIHGCDHIGAEFATRSVSESLPLIATSLERMATLSRRTALPHDKVMVFPQGRFSSAAMQGLRQSEFLAAVNTELLDHVTQRGVIGGELLGPAIMGYGGFPLFLRRRMDEPRENFALDLLLGKPCLIVTHHDDFKEGFEPFVARVRDLNALDPRLRWTNLETIALHSYSVRTTQRGTEIRLYTSTTSLTSAGVSLAHFKKAESLDDRDFDVMVGEEPTKSMRDHGDITFDGTLDPSQTIVRVRVRQLDAVPRRACPIRYRTKVATRRYLSEFRDNYVARSPWATAAVSFLRRRRLPVTVR
jgi:hypothetical protein